MESLIYNMLIPDPQALAYAVVRFGQIVVTFVAMAKVIRYGITCMARAYEAVLLLLVVLAFLAIGNLIVLAADGGTPDIVDWGWLMFDLSIPFLVLRYISEQRKFAARLSRVLTRKGEPTP